MKKSAFILALALSFFAGAALANSTFSQSVISSGGGHNESGIYTLDGAAGQPIVGSFVNGTTTLCVGFPGCGTVPSAGSSGDVYLPIILRSN